MERITNIKDYSKWVDSVWYSKKDTNSIANNTDVSVMTLGLVGEVSEVIEECIDNKNTGIDLQKEIGDVFYYFVRICNHFDLEADELYHESQINALIDNEHNRSTILLQLSKHSGLAADVIKKKIRDDKLNRELLIENLLGVIKYLMAIITAYDFHFFDIINLNVNKINTRKKTK